MSRLLRRTLVALLCALAAPFAVASYDLRLVVQSEWLDEPSRREAINLLVGLLPAGGQAGIWAYGDAVTPLVAPGPVDAAWRSRAAAALAGIEGAQQSAVLHEALHAAVSADVANRDWPRALLLFSDGSLDVSGSPMVNAATIRGLLASPELAGEVGWPIYTTSDASSPGWHLLQALAEVSGGQALPPRSSPPASWLRVLNAALPVMRLPLQDGQLRVPDSVRSFLLLATPATVQLDLQPPEGSPSGEESRATVADYQLHRRESPAAGNWQLSGAETAQVLVLASGPFSAARREFPTRLRSGEPLRGHWRLLQDAKPVESLPEDWSWRVEMTGPGGYAEADTPVVEAGRLQLDLPSPRSPGWYRLEILAGHGAELQSWVYRVAVDAAATGSSISTRPPELPEADLRSAAWSLAGILALLSLLIAWVLRRRRRHKLRIWELRRGSTPSPLDPGSSSTRSVSSTEHDDPA